MCCDSWLVAFGKQSLAQCDVWLDVSARTDCETSNVQGLSWLEVEDGSSWIIEENRMRVVLRVGYLGTSWQQAVGIACGIFASFLQHFIFNFGNECVLLVLLRQKARFHHVFDLFQILKQGHNAVVSMLRSVEFEEELLVATNDKNESMVTKTKAFLLVDIFNVLEGQDQLRPCARQ